MLRDGYYWRTDFEGLLIVQNGNVLLRVGGEWLDIYLNVGDLKDSVFVKFLTQNSIKLSDKLAFLL